MDRTTCLEYLQLELACLFQEIHSLESFSHCCTTHQEPVIAQDERIIGAEIRHKALTFIEIDVKAFIVVIRDAFMELQPALRQRQKPLLKTGNC
jgi:hypothetical protein